MYVYISTRITSRRSRTCHPIAHTAVIDFSSLTTPPGRLLGRTFSAIQFGTATPGVCSFFRNTFRAGIHNYSGTTSVGPSGDNSAYPTFVNSTVFAKISSGSYTLPAAVNRTVAARVRTSFAFAAIVNSAAITAVVLRRVARAAFVNGLISCICPDA